MAVDMKNLKHIVENYRPTCEQETCDRKIMLQFLTANADCLTRDNQIAHFTASSWIVNRGRDKVLMAYHNIYDSWAWTGGHADGEADLLQVAIREACEETGITSVRPVKDRPCSLEIITVDGHIKRGSYVASHLHMNLTYLLEAEEGQDLFVKADENSGVRWIPCDELDKYVSESWMMTRVYEKLLKLL